MSVAPPQPCTVCGRLTHGSRCARHRRPSAAGRGYDRAWASLARRWLRAYPWCGQRLGGVFHGDQSACVRQGREVPAQVVDHIRPLRDGGAPRDLTNLQSLCRSCNVRKG